MSILFQIASRVDTKSYPEYYEGNGPKQKQVVHTHRKSINIVQGQLTERVWCTQSQPSLLNIYFSLSGFFRYCTCSHSTEMCCSFALLQKSRRNHRSCVNRGPIGYGFRAGAKATRI